MTDISTSKPTIVWLEDSVDEIADYLADVRIAPYTVHVAQGFRQLDGLLCSARIENWDVRAIIIDVMIKNVLNLTPYFPFIEAGYTGGGYSAGLVFLERVLERSGHYEHLENVGVIVSSKRALEAAEKKRILDLSLKSRRKIITLEKSSTNNLLDLLSEIRVRKR